MRCSLNEIETMGKRAARGGGMSWGLADEAGKATRWLAAHGMPGPHVLADLLARHDGTAQLDRLPAADEGQWSATGGELCPIATGAAFCDRAGKLTTGHEIKTAAMAHPILLAFHIAGAAKLTGSVLKLEWPGVVMVFSPEGVAITDSGEALLASTVSEVRCSKGDRPAKVLPLDGSGHDVTEQIWERLGTFANRTFAPATEESRLTGAGAGLIDD